MDPFVGAQLDSPENPARIEENRQPGTHFPWSEHCDDRRKRKARASDQGCLAKTSARSVRYCYRLLLASQPLPVIAPNGTAAAPGHALGQCSLAEPRRIAFDGVAGCRCGRCAFDMYVHGVWKIYAVVIVYSGLENGKIDIAVFYQYFLIQ